MKVLLAASQSVKWPSTSATPGRSISTLFFPALPRNIPWFCFSHLRKTRRCVSPELSADSRHRPNLERPGAMLAQLAPSILNFNWTLAACTVKLPYSTSVVEMNTDSSGDKARGLQQPPAAPQLKGGNASTSRNDSSMVVTVATHAAHRGPLLAPRDGRVICKRLHGAPAHHAASGVHLGDPAEGAHEAGLLGSPSPGNIFNFGRLPTNSAMGGGGRSAVSMPRSREADPAGACKGRPAPAWSASTTRTPPETRGGRGNAASPSARWQCDVRKGSTPTRRARAQAGARRAQSPRARHTAWPASAAPSSTRARIAPAAHRHKTAPAPGRKRNDLQNRAEARENPQVRGPLHPSRRRHAQRYNSRAQPHPPPSLGPDPPPRSCPRGCCGEPGPGIRAGPREQLQRSTMGPSKRVPPERPCGYAGAQVEGVCRQQRAPRAGRAAARAARRHSTRPRHRATTPAYLAGRRRPGLRAARALQRGARIRIGFTNQEKWGAPATTSASPTCDRRLPVHRRAAPEHGREPGSIS